MPSESCPANHSFICGEGELFRLCPHTARLYHTWASRRSRRSRCPRPAARRHAGDFCRTGRAKPLQAAQLRALPSFEDGNSGTWFSRYSRRGAAGCPVLPEGRMRAAMRGCRRCVPAGWRRRFGNELRCGWRVRSRLSSRHQQLRFDDARRLSAATGYYFVQLRFARRQLFPASDCASCAEEGFGERAVRFWNAVWRSGKRVFRPEARRRRRRRFEAYRDKKSLAAVGMSERRQPGDSLPASGLKRRRRCRFADNAAYSISVPSIPHLSDGRSGSCPIRAGREGAAREPETLPAADAGFKTAADGVKQAAAPVRARVSSVTRKPRQ